MCFRSSLVLLARKSVTVVPSVGSGLGCRVKHTAWSKVQFSDCLLSQQPLLLSWLGVNICRVGRLESFAAERLRTARSTTRSGSSRCSRSWPPSSRRWTTLLRFVQRFVLFCDGALRYQMAPAEVAWNEKSHSHATLALPISQAWFSSNWIVFWSMFFYPNHA